MLTRANNVSPVDIRSSSDINDVLLQLELQVKSGGKSVEPLDKQIEAVKRFFQTGRIGSLRDARRVAFGLVISATPNRPCLMEERELFGEALNEFDRWKVQSTPRQYSKCYQGLVRSYFDYDGRSRHTPEAGKINWRKLRDYLNDNATRIRSESINPDWVTCATNNVALFGEFPCEAYGKELLNGRESYVNEIRRLLGISNTSWFTEELILARLIEATRLDHPAFQQAISALLRLLDGNKVLQSAGLKILLNRYVQVPMKPQHHELKEFSVACWGNPWLPSNNDSWGGISDEARQMVTEWLSHEYIELFFTKLAQDGLSDTRRVKFWSKYVKSIDSMYFALGAKARSPDERDFVELRHKLDGLTVELHDSNVNNNAFIMKMGNLLAVEFSGQSNAFYGYNTSGRMPFDLSQPVRTPVNVRNSLKLSSHAMKLSHQDNILGYADWEDRFEYELRTKFDIRQGRASTSRPSSPTLFHQIETKTIEPSTSFVEIPVFQILKKSEPSSHHIGDPEKSPLTASSRPPATATSGSTSDAQESFPLISILKNRPFSMRNLLDLSVRTGYKIQDRTDIGGVLWVWAPNDIEHISEILNAWGFKYTAAKCWWKQL